MIEPDPGAGADLNTYYTYDLLNHLTQVSMPRGTVTQTRTFVYDSTTQRMMSATHPESGTATFTYNSDGTVATKIDAKGQKVGYGYDSLQRPTGITVYPNGVTADPCQGVATYYDTNPDDAGKPVPFTQNAAARVAMVAWGGASCAGGYTYHEAFSYSSAGKVEKQRLSVIKSSMQRDLDAIYTYNNEGQVTSVKYPSWDDNGSGSWQVTPGVLYSYAFDSMGRPNKLTDNDSQRPVDWVKDVLYGPAGNVTQTRYLETKGASAPQDVYYLQTHAYNTLYQLTRMTTVREGGGGGTIMDMEYRFSGTQNNGKITQQKDWVSGEEVTYQYDSLQRLIAATTTGPEWGQSFGYDGFGNLLSKSVTKGSAPTLSINVDGATNRITTSGFGYDANGNMTSIPGQSGVAYDVLNRLTTAGGDQYSYRPDNKRLWKKLPGGAEEIYFYSITGERWGAYQPVVSGPSLYLKRNSESLYFAGTMIRSQGQALVMDRLGSVRSFGGTSIRYFPYGEEQTSTANEKNKFGTYFRDGTTGLDYADQRYYATQFTRFLTADPYGDNWNSADSQSWNAFAYTNGDPVNYWDPSGLGTCGDLLTVAGRFTGQTVNQIMRATSGEQLMAQLIYHEGGTIFDSDLNAVGAYFNDLWGIGSGILNLWETDRQILVVYLPNGQVAYPLGTPLSRSLKDVIIAIARDKLGALFDAAGNMRQPDRANIDRVLNTDTASLPLVTNGTGNPMNRGCQGVLSSIGVASDLLNGAPRYSPGGFALLFWNREPPNSTTSSLGSQGYEGIRSDREQGHTFWGLPTVRPPVPKPIRRPPGINAPIRGSEGRAGGSSR